MERLPEGVPPLGLLSVDQRAAAILEGALLHRTPTAGRATLLDCQDDRTAGLSFHGLVRTIDLFLGASMDQATTGELSELFVRPATVPRGWCDEVVVTTVGGARVYRHSYIYTATGKRQSTPPLGTRSFNALLTAEPTMAHFVGTPTHFLSTSAWTGNFTRLVDSLRMFVAVQKQLGGPELFFWCHLFALDLHKQNIDGESQSATRRAFDSFR
jgi:hypothetical protein